MTQTTRTETPTAADERTTLEAMLDYHRATLAMKCEGLSDEQLRTATVPPSELTLLGLVRHLSEVECGWFRNVLGAEDVKPLYYSDEDMDGEFHDLATADTAEAFATWRAQIDRAKELAATRSLDDTGTRRGEAYSLRWIYVHMIEEYARHNGHADLIRERLDGATGE
ncbi:DinB family protein [Streptantibioticus ferralitis]|uniref:DinB family protein n=1 Tax=Streptantibioticus ferralitis TaxID=236510 RepID=A0ABT5Z8J8_9ACTN|nr:DinB family protein [Streptantibioticus ferralitis]MDF2260155.1 DinB family protein [Streptantibioticus ferralitis]